MTSAVHQYDKRSNWTKHVTSHRVNTNTEKKLRYCVVNLRIGTNREVSISLYVPITFKDYADFSMYRTVLHFILLAKFVQRLCRMRTLKCKLIVANDIEDSFPLRGKLHTHRHTHIEERREG